MGDIKRRKFYSHMRMESTAWLSMLLAVLAFVTPALSSSPRVVCYYTNWSVYRPGTARFNPQNINPYLCTHLVYAFGGFTKDNSLKPFDKYQDIEKGGYAKFTGLKTYNKNLKTLLAIGGWNEGSSRFSPMVASRDRRKEFVRNAIKFLRQNHFDGLDLDWEYPAFRDGGKPKDRENYAKLVKELREEFERESEKTGKPRLLLTMAVPAGIEYIQKGFDVETLNRYLDWMNLLTYDYHSAFEPAVNHHAPLYPLEEPNEYSVDNELNIDYTIKFYLENGADRDKLVLGIPTYGRSYTLFNPDAVDIGSPADGPGEQGDATREKGYLAYYEICEALKPKQKKRSIDSDEESEEDSEEEEDEEWTVMHPNPSAMGPVAFKGNQWVGYDDIDIVKKKAEYVAENGLGGIMFWSIDNDDFRGTCHEKPYPLIEAAKEAYIVKLGSTDNAIVTDKPRSRSSSGGRRRSKPRASSTTTTTTTTTTPKPISAKSSKRKSSSALSSTPAWNIITPEPPTTPDPGADFKCTDEGFFQHPRDCKKYFWCLDSGPSNLGIVAHQFTCPSGLFFNKAADSCDFARNVLCKKTAATTKATTKATTTKVTTTTTTTTTTRRPIRLTSKSSLLFRTTTTTTPVPEVIDESEEEDEEETVPEDNLDVEAEDPKVIKELIDLIKKVGGVEQLEKQLRLSETSASTGGLTISTTPTPFNKRLYQKVLERTRGKSRFGNSVNSIEGNSQNSRRAPQNAGLEPTADKDKLLKKDRPQYTTINRSRPSTTSTTQEPETEDSEELEEDSAQEVPLTRARAVQREGSLAGVATTAKPLQYVNIRRSRPTTAAPADDDDNASRNALFERAEPYPAVSETANTLEIANAKRESIPEYVTIRRTRPTTEETTTAQYQNRGKEDESQETALEREISSPSSQSQYTSIIRTRSTTLPPPEEPSSPEPTTILSVQISSLLNSPNSAEVESSAPETTPAPTEPEPTTASSTTPSSTTTTAATTATSTTAAPSSLPTRRNILRRRGSTTTTTSTSAPVSSTQVSSRNYSFIRRRRPLSQSNEISSDSSESFDTSRKIRSTTPDSREIGEVKTNSERGSFRRFRSRFQPTQNDDSVPAAAISRGQVRAQPDQDELLSLTPIDVELPQFIPRESLNERSDKRVRGRTSTTVADAVEDSEGSAATIDERRPSSIVPRGRGRYSSFTTTESLGQSTATEAPRNAQRKPTFARFTPRPFTRASTTTTTAPDDDLEQSAAPIVSQRTPPRLPFGRIRPVPAPRPIAQARKLPFPSRRTTTTTTTQSTLTSESNDDDIEGKNDDISLSESAIEEKEHEEYEDSEEEQPKRRIVLKKIVSSDKSTVESSTTTELTSDDSGKRKFRVIRRRPTSTTSANEVVDITTESTTLSVPRIRKIIRKKLRPSDDESENIAKSVNSLNTGLKLSTAESESNYGERTRTTLQYTISTTTTEKMEDVFDEASIVAIELNKENKDEKELITENKEDISQDSIITNESLSDEIQKGQNDEDADKLQEKPSEENLTKDNKPEVIIETDDKYIDLSENSESKSDDVKSTSDSEENVTENKESADVETVSHSYETILTNEKTTELKEEVSTGDEEKTSEVKDSVINNEEVSSDPVTEADDTNIETTTTSTTQLTSPSTRTRLPYRPPKRLFTSTTETSLPSSSRTFSRKYNPGVYTSPATVDKPDSLRPTITRRPLFSKTFTRRPFTTARTTQRFEEELDEEYSDEEILDEEPEPENPFVFVPSGQLFTRKPDSSEDEVNEDDESEDLGDEEPEEELFEEEQPQRPLSRFTPSTRKPLFKPRIVNSNTFRASSTTTELPRKQFGSNQNKTTIFNRFASNKPVNDTKKRVQNVPIGYSAPKPSVSTYLSNFTTETRQEKDSELEINDSVTTNVPTVENETTLNDNEDDYLTMTETVTSENTPTTNAIEIETIPFEMDIDNSTNDYLEYTENTTNYPTQNTDTQTEINTDSPIYLSNTIKSSETTTQAISETTTIASTVTPIVKTQFNKLFSVSRVVEVSSKLDKHRLNKNNETTLIEEGQVMVEKKPTVDKIGEVSRFSLIKIVEDEIPIYLTKLGHVYPVDNPPDNPIRIDEARNARALTNFADYPKENLVASESMNEAYRHVNKVLDESKKPSPVEHADDDDFLSYINDDQKSSKTEEGEAYASWQFVPAAFENDQNKDEKPANTFEVVTPRIITNPSTLPLEALFKTESPIMARKVSNDKENQPFLVYSAPVSTQKEDANIVKLHIIKPETSRSIITFANGQEFQGASVTAVTDMKYPINITVLPQSTETTATSTTTTTERTTERTMENTKTSPIIELLTTTQISTILTSEPTESTISTTFTTDVPTTETTPEEITTKISPLDTKKGKFAFPRRPIIKSNFTRPSPAPRLPKKINATVTTIPNQKPKTSGFNPNKTRFSANRAQNVPIDIRKKSSTTKFAKSFTTETPRSTTERKVFIKPIRPNFRPAFVPRKSTTPPIKINEET